MGGRLHRCCSAGFAALALLPLVPAWSQPADDVRAYEVVGDAIPLSLTGVPGDAGRGRARGGTRLGGVCGL